MTNEERRQSTRVPFQTTADLQFHDREFTDRETGDLSVKGVLVHGVHDRKLGDECAVLLHLIGASSDLALRMRGKVVRILPEGVAIKFHEIDLDSFYHLKNIVYYNVDNPDDLSSEFDPETADDIDDAHFE